MIALIWFVLAILASPFKSKSRLEAENAVVCTENLSSGVVPVGNLIRLASEAESRNVSIL
jgi:hypothetical protein